MASSERICWNSNLSILESIALAKLSICDASAFCSSKFTNFSISDESALVSKI